MSEPPVLSIVIVNWNTADLLVSCLRSIAGTVSLPHEILVVDNASDDGSRERVQRDFPRVRLLALESNVGFARANNRALTAAAGRFLLLLNPDTELRAAAVESVVSFLETNPSAGIAGPPLWNADGSHQPSVQIFPTLASELLHQTMFHRILPTRLRREARRRDTRRVEVVTGAALCIRRECYDAIGPLDEDTFMFYEDVDWCRRAHEAGWEVWYVDGPGIVHLKGAASRGAARTRTLLDSLRGGIHYFRKHHGDGAVAGLRSIALLGATTRSLRAILLLALGRDREDQRSRLRAYTAMMRWALTGREPVA